MGRVSGKSASRTRTSVFATDCLRMETPTLRLPSSATSRAFCQRLPGFCPFSPGRIALNRALTIITSKVARSTNAGKAKKGNAFYGKDECTGQCRTEDCVYINIDDDLRRCCEGASDCDTQCPDRKALITGLSVGLGTPVLLVCICVVLIAWDDDNFVEDTCGIAYRGVRRLLAWTG